MIVREVREINDKKVNYIYSDIGAVLRCGRLRYINAADPINVEKAYFEEGVEPVETEDLNNESN